MERNPVALWRLAEQASFDYLAAPEHDERLWQAFLDADRAARESETRDDCPLAPLCKTCRCKCPAMPLVAPDENYGGTD